LPPRDNLLRSGNKAVRLRHQGGNSAENVGQRRNLPHDIGLHQGITVRGQSPDPACESCRSSKPTMAALDACTRSRTGRWLVVLALAALRLLASCAQDAVAPGRGTLGPAADLSAGPPAEFYVSPTGSPAGDGSFTNPWDLATALDGPPGVTPGSTIWLRGGTYTNGTYYGGYWSNLTGTAAAPIVVRDSPGERATVTKFLIVRGAYTWFWGLEVVNPDPGGVRALGVDTRGPGTKLINVVVHDASASGIYVGLEASNAEVYGSISYNNGRTDNLDHGIYCQSQTSTLLKDNIVFDNWAYGIHCYASAGEYLQNITLEGNVAFNTDVWGMPGSADILVGGQVPASGITIDRNYTYRTNYSNTRVADVGYDQAMNQDVVLTNNYFIGGWSHVGAWATATATGNTLFNFNSGGMLWNIGNLSGQTWSGNTFFGDSTATAWLYTATTAADNSATTFSGWRTLTRLTDPGRYAASVLTGVNVLVRPNQYELGRANIIVYNWAQQGTVSVDVSGILNVGDHYVVQHAQDLYGAPIAGGTYDGGPLQLPAVSITPPTPLGTSTVEPAPVTGPTFNVFVLMKTP